MQKIFLYRKWNLLIFLNGALSAGFFTYKKKIISLRFDTSNFFFWVYAKKIKFQNTKVLKLKTRFKFFN